MDSPQLFTYTLPGPGPGAIPMTLQETPREDREFAMVQARTRFIADFPRKSASIGLLLGMIASLGRRGPVTALKQILLRLSDTAEALGFPRASVRASALQALITAADEQVFDVEAADIEFDRLFEAFTADLSEPPPWTMAVSDSVMKARILVAEADEEQRQLLAYHLRSAGHEAIGVDGGDLVDSGELVAETARRERPSLVLLDSGLPGLDGYGVCRLLKADPDLAHIPVMFMTPRSSLDSRIASLMLGADEYLTKPFEPSELLFRIQRVLKERMDRARHDDRQQARPVRADTGALDYDAFIVVARDRLQWSAASIGLISVPDDRADEIALAVRDGFRRGDVVARYDANHLLVFLPDATTMVVYKRLDPVVARLAVKGITGLRVGVAYSGAAGSKTIEQLIAEADEVLASSAVVQPVKNAMDGSAAGARARRVAILLGDDDPLGPELEAGLRRAGYDASVLDNAANRAQSLVQAPPDGLVLDLSGLPEVALDLLADLAHAIGPQGRILTLAGQGAEEDVRRALRLGATDFIFKPFAMEELLARMARLLR
jgi:DNA-binding response OmpR family regulator